MNTGPRILLFAGSIRSGSHNTRLAGVTAKSLSAMQCDPTWITLRDFPMPIYDGDLEKQDGPPENAVRLARMMHEQDGMIIVSPEYNSSITPLLKNTLDWVSRVKRDSRGELSPYKGKIIGLASASPGGFGGMRSLMTLRVVLTAVQALVVPQQLSVADAANAFDDSDELVSERHRNMLDALCSAVVDHAAALASGDR